MNTDPSLDQTTQHNALEALPAAAQRLLEMKIQRPGGKTENVIKEIILPSKNDKRKAEEVRGFIDTIVANLDNPMKQRLVESQLAPLVDFLEGPMVLDIFEHHEVETTDNEEEMGRRAWRHALQKKDPEAWAYTERNVLRINSGMSAVFNAIETMNAAGQPPTDEGRAALARWMRGVLDLRELIEGKGGTKAPVGENDEARRLREIHEIIEKTGKYNSLSDAQKIQVVRLARQFSYQALKELAPYYAA